MRDRTRSFWQNHPVWSLLIAAVVIVGLTLGAVKGIPAIAHAFDDRPTPSEETLDAISIKTPTEECVPDDKSLGTVNMRVESMNPVGTGQGERLWSDSVALPMAGNDQVLSLGQIMDTVCHDPHYGHVVANGLAKLDVGNVALVSRNDWLKSLSLESVPSSAAAYMPTLNVERPSFGQATEAVKKNQEWQVAASYINTLLKNLGNMGYHSPQSVWNIHLTGFDAGVKLPTVGLNDHQENLPALVLGLTEKGQECPILQIAFNTGDKRPEGVDICKGESRPVVSTPVQEAPQKVVTPAKPGRPVTPVKPNKPVNPPKQCTTCCSGCPPPPPPPPVPCPNGCPPPEESKTLDIPHDEGIQPAPQDVFEPAPSVPAPDNFFVPDTPAGTPSAPIVGNPSSPTGATAPEASTSAPPGMDHGSNGAGTPALVDPIAPAQDSAGADSGNPDGEGNG